MILTTLYIFFIAISIKTNCTNMKKNTLDVEYLNSICHYCRVFFCLFDSATCRKLIYELIIYLSLASLRVTYQMQRGEKKVKFVL